MTEFFVSPVSRRRLPLVRSLCFISLSALAVVNCSGSAATTEQTLFGIETSSFSVVVVNKVGMPVSDVDVAIVPVGRAVLFTKMAGRMDNGEKREISLNNFYGRDGTPFSLRVVRPKSVRVTAKDMNNKPIEVEVPWK
jgi:hypothetical protein